MQITSFGYTLAEVNLTILDEGMVTYYYQKNGEWQLVAHTAYRTEFTHDHHNYSRIVLQLDLARRPSYHALNLVLPVIVNSLLVPFVFKLSPKSGEKMGFSITVLLSYMVVLTLLSEVTPSTSVYTSVLGELYIYRVRLHNKVYPK